MQSGVGKLKFWRWRNIRTSLIREQIIKDSKSRADEHDSDWEDSICESTQIIYIWKWDALLPIVVKVKKNNRKDYNKKDYFIRSLSI